MKGIKVAQEKINTFFSTLIFRKEDNKYYLFDTRVYKENQGIYSQNIIMMSLFAVATISTATLIPLIINGTVNYNIGSYALIGTSLFTILVGAILAGSQARKNIRLRTDQYESGLKAFQIIMSVSAGILLNLVLRTNGMLSTFSVIENAGIAAGIALIIPVIYGFLYITSPEVDEDDSSIPLVLLTIVIPALAGIAVGTFSALAMNISTGNVALDIAVELSAGSAIAIASAVVLSSLFKAIYASSLTPNEEASIDPA